MTLLDTIGRLPDQWDASPLRSVADYIVSNVDKLASEDEIPVHLCNYTDVYHNEFITLDLEFMSATASKHEIEKFGLSKGDVIITKDSESWDDIGVPALVRETTDNLVCGYHLALLRPHKKIMDGAFLFRCLQARPIRLQLELSARGVTRFGLSKLEIGAMVLPVPPLPQQRAIADYLDRETTRLDSLVTAKERMLELLAERRKALIVAAVTRSVDSVGRAERSDLHTTCKKDSVNESRANRRGNHASPARDDWVNTAVTTTVVSRRKLKHLASVNDDLLEENIDAEFEMQYIDIGNVDPSGRISEIAQLRFGDAPSRARRLVRDGDVIISTVRTYLQAITQIREPPDNLVVSTGFAVVRPLQDRFDARYCRFALREPAFLAEVEKRSVGANYPAINVSDLTDILIPVHSLPQQRAIADYLDRETAKLDSLKVKIQSTITLLKERRAALIAAAVTGQINVESAA